MVASGGIEKGEFYVEKERLDTGSLTSLAPSTGHLASNHDHQSTVCPLIKMVEKMDNGFSTIDLNDIKAQPHSFLGPSNDEKWKFEISPGRSIDQEPPNSGKSIIPTIHRYKTFLSILILSIAWVMNDVVLAWVHERVPYQSDPLPDIWFSVFPEYQSAIKLTEALLIICLIMALSIIIFHHQRWLVCRRVFFISALCYFGRAFCITLTQVPVPSRHTYCATRANQTNVLLILTRVGGTLSGMGMDTLLKPRQLCGDLIYSGHTTILCLCFLTVTRYAPRNIKWLGYMAQSMALIGVIGILIARKHYTLDVVLAYYITTRVYWIYHTMADNKSTFYIPSNGSINKTNVTSVFWAPFISFLESDAPPNFNNYFDIPFPSTRTSTVRIVKRVLAKGPKFNGVSWNRNGIKMDEDDTKNRQKKSAQFLDV